MAAADKCPGPKEPHTVTYKAIAPIGATELADGVNAISCCGGRAWVPDFRAAWLEAMAAQTSAAPAVPPADAGL